MISFITGTVATKGMDYFVMNYNGMGFHIIASNRTLQALDPEDQVTIYTYLSVREDALNLYGFIDEDELGIFELLITVKGVGPKVAIGILSGLSPDAIRKAIASKDVALLTKAPGVGKKTAERIQLELKDKISWTGEEDEELEQVEEVVQRDEDELVEALMSLGYSRYEIHRAIKKLALTEDQTIEDKIRLALKELMK